MAWKSQLEIATTLQAEKRPRIRRPSHAVAMENFEATHHSFLAAIRLLEASLVQAQTANLSGTAWGRIALAAEISIQSIQSASIICYNLHLESRSNDELRLAQLNEVLQDAGACDSTRPIVVAGDLNLNASKPAIADVLARVGFRDVVPSSRVPTTPSRHLLEAGRHIDWAFVRDPVQADAGKVHRSVASGL